jgi:AcrR family transcriptional regulator
MNTMSSEKRKYELRARAARQDETRQRIVAATSELHEEVGPARTTVAEIARRAGVQRLTVYKHFPDERGLFAACGAHWLAGHPPPDPEPLFAIEDSAERLHATLLAFYTWYRANQAMTLNIRRDRILLPALDDVVRGSTDSRMAWLAAQLALGFGADRATQRRVRPAVALALDFWTWRRLEEEGLDDKAAAGLMVTSVQAVAAVLPTSQ